MTEQYKEFAPHHTNSGDDNAEADRHNKNSSTVSTNCVYVVSSLSAGISIYSSGRTFFGEEHEGNVIHLHEQCDSLYVCFLKIFLLFQGFINNTGPLSFLFCFLQETDDCGAPCHAMFFPESERTVLRYWVGSWAAVCVASCLFTVSFN